MANASLVFLITGCSSGIGRATASGAAAAGHRVFATARRPESIADLAGTEHLALDVTDPASIRRAVQECLSRAGRIDVLVNNAGYGQMGPVEDIPVSKWKEEFEVNFFGIIEMTQAVLPAMRQQGSGTIVMIGSIGGLISYPFGGPYCASKYALEALTDALRLEVRPFGVGVVLIEPGPIRTHFAETAEQSARPFASNPQSAYHPTYEKAFTRFAKETTIGALPPEAVARAVLRAVRRRRPPIRLLITAPARIGAIAKRLLPGRVMDFGMRRKFR
jgi:NAD(P)-dependent dehydrogenase (short-subunit alcohol dehydrogenase family)